MMKKLLLLVIPVMCLLAPKVTFAAFATDDFNTLTAGTELIGRTASGGGVWAGSTGFFSGSTGGGTINSSSSAGRGTGNLGTPAGTDYSVQGTMTLTSTLKSSIGFLTRYQDGSNYIFAYWAAGNWEILKRSAAVDTRVDSDGSATNNPTTARTVVLTVSGTSPNIRVTLTSDGVTVATATINDANLNAKGSPGVYNGFADVGQSTIDNWSASDPIPVGETAFRFRNDDGSESAATWYANENTSITQTINTSQRLRLQASTTGDLPSNQFQLEYKLSTDNWWTVASSTRYGTSTSITPGTFTSGTGALSVPAPASAADGDVLLMCAESANQNITTPTGWTQVTNSPQSYGTAAAQNSVRSAVFYKIASGTLSNTTVADSGDHTTAQIFAIRGVASSSPIDADAGSAEAASTTAMSWPSVTTTYDNEMIFQCAGIDDDAADSDNVTGITNANLVNLTEVGDTSVASGAGGGIAAYVGTKLVAGSIGNTTATGDTSNRHTYHTVALRPLIQKFLVWPSSNITASGENTTAQLSVPSGKSFTAGRIQDDENPSDAVDIASDRYSEFEWNLQATSDAVDAEVYDFRLTKYSTNGLPGSAFDAYNVSPQWTIGTPAGGGTTVAIAEDLLAYWED